MYEYHGWASTYEPANETEIVNALKGINVGYPVSAQMVNGKMHISFSGNPNRNLGKVEEIVSFLCGLKLKVSGCVYINDPDSERYNQFDVVKIVEDVPSRIDDRNFTIEETRLLFE